MKTKKELAELRTAFLVYAEMEPRLLDLEKTVRRIARDTAKDEIFCLTKQWYGYGLGGQDADGNRIDCFGIRHCVKFLVGWSRGNNAYRNPVCFGVPLEYQPGPVDLKFGPVPEEWWTEDLPRDPHPLAQSDAYDAVYRYLYERLPDCRHTPNILCG